jgi:hypothetical protein
VNEATEHAWNFQREMPHVRPRAQVMVAEPYSGTLEGLITRFRWHLTALREWCKRLGMAQQGEEYGPRIPPDVPIPKHVRGPVQVIVERPDPQPSGYAFLGKVLVGIAIGVVVGYIGFIGGAIWSHNTRITTLETFRVSDKEGQDKLEKRVDDLATRIK